jgi:hypothetical protein
MKTLGTVLKALLLACWIIAIVAACAEALADGPAPESASRSIPSSVSRFIDHDYGNVCYLYRGYEKGGISCVPLRE